MEPSPPSSPALLAQLSNGWWAFKTLAAAIELGVFSQMAESNGMSVADFARQNDIEERPAEMLLTACASLGLLKKSGDRYLNSETAVEYLIPGKHFYFGDWILLCDLRVEGWNRLVQAIRANRSVTWDPGTGQSLFQGEEEKMLTLFWRGMHSLSVYGAYQFARTADFADVRNLLDLGGCSGTFSVELCLHHPHIQAAVFDLPFIIGTAGQRIREHGLEARISTIAGDFFADEDLPGGFDGILLSMILHDWSEPANKRLLAKCFEVLPSGGVLYICELLVNDEKTGPPAAALMSLNMLVETEGRNYTESEYRTWLVETGFVEIRTTGLDSPGINAIITARKP